MRHVIQFAVLLLAALLGASPALAGGGPENVFLVVNARSWASLSLANYFIQLRRLPESNVLYLDWTGPIDQVSLTQFRDQLLVPIERTLEQRRLVNQIDYLIYSSDFPWRVDASAELAGQKLPEQLRPIGSLTGLSYFAPTLTFGQIEFLRLDANHYCRRSPNVDVAPSSHAFRHWYGWDADGSLLEAGGQRYRLSMMLGVTSGRGNSVREAIQALRRSAAADGSHPTGTIYYDVNNDVRSRTRQATIPAAAAALGALGVRAQVIANPAPVERDDVQGVTMGAAEFDWRATGSTLRPGAIGDNLTSCGGMLLFGDEQTPLTEFLRYGAAGASGAVIEPFSIQEKFPLPAIHLHYARGCSLAEAYYQSIASPYQLLIVGDPLCQPWATPPKISLEASRPGDTWRGQVQLQPRVDALGRAPVERFEWFLDGMHLATSAGIEPVTFHTAAMPDGYHELRLVTAELGEIETQGRLVVPVVFNNREHHVELRRTDMGVVRWGQPLRVSMRCDGAAHLALLHGSRLVGRCDGAAGEVTLEPRDLGLGPVRLRAVAVGLPAPDVEVVSPPLDVTIEPSEPLAGEALDGAPPLEAGFQLTLADDTRKIIPLADGPNWLGLAGAASGQPFQVAGIIEIREPDLYQFQVRYVDRLTLEVDDQKLYESAANDELLHMIPVALARGRHRVRLAGIAPAPARMDLWFGAAGLRYLSGQWLRHAATPEKP